MAEADPVQQIRRRRTRAGGGTRDVIVAAAAEVLGSKGFAGSSIDEVAEQAGVTKATVYYHFSSKEDLYAAVRVELLNASTAEAREAVRDIQSPVTALAHLVDLTIQFTLDRSRRYMFFHEIIPIRPEVQRAIGVAQREYAQLLEEVVARGQAEGIFIPGRPRMIVAIMLGSIARTLTWYRESGEVPPPEFSKLLRTMVLGGVYHPAGEMASELASSPGTATTR